MEINLESERDGDEWGHVSVDEDEKDINFKEYKTWLNGQLLVHLPY